MPTYNSLVRKPQGGSALEIASGGAGTVSGSLIIASGGAFSVASGGAANVASGGSLTVAAAGGLTVGGTTITTTFVDAIAAGYKIATGTAAFSSSGTVSVVTGLATVTTFVAFAYGAGTSNISGQAAWYEGSLLSGGAGGTVNVYAYATTGTAVATSKTIHWEARGT